MLLLLPPSETKRDGGLDSTALDLGALSFAALTSQRVPVVAGLRRLSRSVGGSMTALSLGPTQRFEIDRNRAVATSPVMPAVERYTGVLYDALDVASLSEPARAFAGEHLVIHSALLGLVRGSDPIPAYRLSHDSRLPGLSLRRHWREAVTAVLAAEDGLVLDLRSDSYIALGPTPSSAVPIRVVSEDARGRRVALSHFNKAGKGRFARAVVEAGVVHPDLDSLLEWAATRQIRLDPTETGLDLVV
ncbi:peroxide stress protein YaaA [Salinibacterium sp. G-O1]|uniref:YaaA family protein n=1 Tax=Salinibacterium sp. G-O1 TaxID=3046208 RepID=UPI0024B8D349|nr:peroxide stress protein YaaA [Salinibacterium sp. G-O1]MDJ0334687.1 peroxide stress protein YaaA [Salinibacterium sp. G-O1]